MRFANLGRPGSALVVIGWTLVVVLVAFVAYAMLARFVLHGPVASVSLAEAVIRESGSADATLDDEPNGCRRLSASRWSCTVGDQQGSGGVTYRVSVEADGSCWDATLADDHSEGGMPAEIEGCVYRWQWTLLDLI